MMLDGRVLLDSKNHPVKDWPGLNKTLSSEIEDWRWEMGGNCAVVSMAGGCGVSCLGYSMHLDSFWLMVIHSLLGAQEKLKKMSYSYTKPSDNPDQLPQ